MQKFLLRSVTERAEEQDCVKQNKWEEAAAEESVLKFARYRTTLEEPPVQIGSMSAQPCAREQMGSKTQREFVTVNTG